MLRKDSGINIKLRIKSLNVVHSLEGRTHTHKCNVHFTTSMNRNSGLHAPSDGSSILVSGLTGHALVWTASFLSFTCSTPAALLQWHLCNINEQWGV